MLQDYALSDVRGFMHKIYGWMASALTITAFVAYYVSSTPNIYMNLFKSPILMIIICVAQIAIVYILNSKIKYLNFASALGLFFVYSAMVGVTVSSVLLIYTGNSISIAFISTAATFLAMAIYGYFTKSDLSGLGHILSMGVWGIFIAMLVNIFFKSSAVDYYISLVAIGIFTLLIAYDIQKIKTFAQSISVDFESKNKLAILCALKLYLDFINLFMHLIRLIGKRKE